MNYILKWLIGIVILFTITAIVSYYFGYAMGMTTGLAIIFANIGFWSGHAP